MILSDEEIHEDYKALRGDKPKRYIEIYRAAEAAILAKLAIAELPEPVARTMRLIGNDDYAKKRGYCARTYNELPKGMYSDTWQDLELLYTYDQLCEAYAQGAAAQLDRLEKAEKDAERLREKCDHAMSEVNRLTVERDAFRSTLQEAREALQFANDTPNGPICDTIWMMHRPETLFDFMDSAMEASK